MEARWCGSQQGQAQSQTPGFQRGPGSWVTLGHSVNPSTRLLLLHQMPSSLLGCKQLSIGNISESVLTEVGG